tara:strand:+ start:3067 stop:3222 length:156 start_codon:yes stop_codon:yes gene_type:complete
LHALVLLEIYLFVDIPVSKWNSFIKMVGNVGYAPTTPAMSMQYSTIELIPL